MRVVVLSILSGRGSQTETERENYNQYTEHFRESSSGSSSTLPEKYKFMSW